MSGVIYLGDCLDILPTLDAESVDAVVTDPPYHLTAMTKRFGKDGAAPANGAAFQRHNAGFMGKAWDGGDIAFRPETWEAVMRVMKPGAHLLAFGGTRTYHRLACAIEDAGFEIRDCLTWLYGSGFPKSLDVSKAIDKSAGHWRGKAGEVVSDNGAMSGANYDRTPKGDPITAAAAAAAGWGTALKPALEPIVMARKPLSEPSVAANWRRHGTGAINVDGCRIDAKGERFSEPGGAKVMDNTVYGLGLGLGLGQHPAGRWPANVILDEAAAQLLDEQTGELHSQNPETRRSRSRALGVTQMGTGASVEYADSGGASRFFYTAKADTAERMQGMATRNTHPTVKPVDLMAWLVRLVTPPGGVVLDPFLGSGTTGIACEGQGFSWLGIEREAEYVEIARQRCGMFVEVVA